jgi:GT2 family glycosyltransferase
MDTTPKRRPLFSSGISPHKDGDPVTQILIVVVRYKISLEDSQTMAGLAQSFRRQPELLQSMRVLVWDNSPTSLDQASGTFPFDYNFSEQNLGVSGAYNGAMAWAESIGCPWLLLLDQDTRIAEEYLSKMLSYCIKLQQETRIAAIVPFVRSRDMLISPQRFGRFVRNHQVPKGVSGIIEEPAGAINSGTVMRVSALRAIDGYSDTFWLDYSDTFVFTTLYRSGYVIYLAGDLELTHSLANLDYNNNMGTERYRSFLAAENIYHEMFHSRFQNIVFTLWLLARTGRQYCRFKNKEFAKLTLRTFCRRIFTCRLSRMKLWQKELRIRSIPAIAAGKIIG